LENPVCLNNVHPSKNKSVAALEEEDVEEAFINGKHRLIEDPECDYEEERRLQGSNNKMNKKVKERLSQLGLSPQTLKNKQRKLVRDLESKHIPNVPS
jgi:hypothetical protein